ncbi:hypothetical protein L8S22_10525, partial [Enterobacter roggenkampii]|nr:hypothetical protein [Enterobacter roggenkampii]
GISLSERIPAAAGIVNLRYKSCPEMAGQDHNGGKGTPTAIAKYNHNTRDLAIIKDQLEASKTMKELLSKGAKL